MLFGERSAPHGATATDPGQLFKIGLAQRAVCDQTAKGITLPSRAILRPLEDGFKRLRLGQLTGLIDNRHAPPVLSTRGVSDNSVGRLSIRFLSNLKIETIAFSMPTAKSSIQSLPDEVCLKAT